MAQISPFRALRFSWHAAAQQGIGALVCPPYDIISEEQRAALLARDPHNIIRLELPTGEDPYAQAGKTLQEWRTQGVLEQDIDDGIYIYEEEFTAYGETKKVSGIFCRVKLEEFSAGVVLPHEETLSKAKEDRFQLMRATNCNFSSIYSLYMDPEHVTQTRTEHLMACTQPRYTFSDGEVTHRLWVVNDPVAIQAYIDDFADRKLYIADGHHRYETALRFRKDCAERGLMLPGSDYVLMMLVDMAHEGLVVYPTHRLLENREALDLPALLSACEADFTVTAFPDRDALLAALQNAYAAGEKAFGLIAPQLSPTLLTLRGDSVPENILPQKSAAYRSLDVSILHTLVLEKHLGITPENMADQKNLRYTRSLPEAFARVDAGESQCAFLLNPTRVEEIAAVAGAGEKMPQKSTYFYPKLITGVVMNDLEH